MSIEVNGVTLPDIPVVEGYPYVVVVQSMFSGLSTPIYGLMFAKEPLYVYKTDADKKTLDALDGACDLALYNWRSELDTWMSSGEVSNASTDVRLFKNDSSSQVIFWANYDVCYAESTDGVNYTATSEIYFPSSVTADTKRYSAPRTWFFSVANKTRVLTGSNDALTIDTMPSKLEDVKSRIDEFIARATTLTEYSNSRITTLGAYAFYEDASLQKLDLPNVQALEADVCAGAQNLLEANLPELKMINGDGLFDSYAFEGTGITEVYFPKLTTIGNADVAAGYAFRNCTKLKKVDFPELTSITGSGTFMGCTSLIDANLPKLKTLGYFTNFVGGISYTERTFQDCTSLMKLNLPVLSAIYGRTFYGCTKLETLILRSETLAPLNNTNAFTNTPIASGTGYIYVPSALLDSYKAATNWSTYAAQFRAIEDYPDICGTTE